MSDENFLICGVVEVVDLPIVGSVLANCSHCGRGIWVSPTGQRILAKESPTLLCIPCGDVHIREDDEAEIMPLNAEQVAEIRTEIERRRR